MNVSTSVIFLFEQLVFEVLERMLFESICYVFAHGVLKGKK